jgi:hypothetical protein
VIAYMQQPNNMENTQSIALFMGTLLLVVGVSMVLKRRMMTDIFDDVFSKRGIAYLLGMLELAGGIILVSMHNVWKGFLPSLVTLLSWFLLAEGVMYMFASRKEMRFALKWLHKKDFYYLLSLFYILLGGYLTFEVL